jgi:hydroxymethylglutaryl-CoA lyase
MEFDIATFDSSAGGMGGCPYAEGATGNIASEKVVALCESLGIETGINKSKLDEASNLIQSIVAKESLTHAKN